MQVNSYISFNGQCEEAFHFYEQALGGKIIMMSRYEHMPPEYKTPPEWNQKIMHGRLEIGDTTLMGSDAMPNRYQTPQGIQMSLSIEDPEEAQRVFAALAEGGQVQMPIQPTFWAKQFGMLVDRFSIPWMVNC